MIRSSLRALKPKASSYTALVVPTKGCSLFWSNGLYTVVCFMCHYFSGLSCIISFELNLSATESALTVVSHYRPMPSHDPKALRVC